MVAHGSSLALACAGRTDVGRRGNNEDAVFYSPRLAAVADGVGGAAAGEVASRSAIEELIHLDKCRLEEPLPAALATAVMRGNARIAFIAECRPQYAGMSTTLTAVALGPTDTYVVANIGDSRTYLLRNGELRQVTRDDSLVQQLVDSGHLSADAARRHPQRSVVLGALDGDPIRRPAVHTATARIGDRLLLCSDGLSDVVDLPVLEGVLRSETRDDAARRLVDVALAAGSRDNITVVVADVVPRRLEDYGWVSANP